MARIKKKASGKRHNIWFMIMIGGLLFIALAVVLIIPYVEPVRITDSSLPYEYRIEGNHIVLERYTGNEEEVVIPERILLWKVTELGNWYDTDIERNKGIFENNETIKRVIMPIGITFVEYECFYNCYNLEEVIFSESLTEIGGVFWDCNSLEHIEIPKNVKSLNATFYNCVNLKEVKLPQGLEKIYSYTFAGCDSLEKLEIPNSLKYIGEGALKDKWLTNPDEEFVTVGKNVLIRYNGTGSIVKIPEGIEYIGVGVFDEHEEIEKIILPKSLKEVYIHNFSSLKNLKYIMIQNEEMVYPTWKNDKIADECPNVTLIAPQGSTTEAYVKGLEYPYPYAESIQE